MLDAEVVEFLEARGVHACVIGATAMAAHGWARYTADVDLLTMDRRVLDESFWPSHLGAEIHRGDADDPLEGVVRLARDPVHDLIVGRGFTMRYAVESSSPHRELGCAVASPAALVLLKLEAGSPQDQFDILSFVDAQRTIDGAAWLPQVDSLIESASTEASRLWNELRPRLIRS